MATERKIKQVAELTDLFNSSSAVILTQYRGLTVAQIKEVRVKIGENANYVVAKNTLAKIAAKNANFEGLDEDFLKGPTAICFVKGDVVAAAKVLRDTAKANDCLAIVGAVYEGKSMSAADVEKLASLESREVLLAKTAGAVKAGIAKAAYVFNAPASKAIRTIDALKAKKEA